MDKIKLFVSRPSKYKGIVICEKRANPFQLNIGGISP